MTVDGRKVFAVVWRRYQQIRVQCNAGRLRISRKKEQSSPQGMPFSFAQADFLADVETAAAAAIRHALPDQQEKRRRLFLQFHVWDFPMRTVAKHIGVSERHAWRMVAELEELIGLEMWVRGFCGTIAGAREFEPALVYFGVKDGILVERGLRA